MTDSNCGSQLLVKTALTQYKNAAFREADHARNLLINSVPNSTVSVLNGTHI